MFWRPFVNYRMNNNKQILSSLSSTNFKLSNYRAQIHTQQTVTKEIHSQRDEWAHKTLN